MTNLSNSSVLGRVKYKSISVANAVMKMIVRNERPKVPLERGVPLEIVFKLIKIRRTKAIFDYLL